MRRFFSLCVTVGLAACSGAAMADEIMQTTTPSGGTVTTVESPSGTTQITTTPGQSVVTQAKDGTRIEMDSDNSVYTVFPDGARASAPDGMTTLMDGTTITVKDGKRIP